jgi:hypothetical protein
MLRLVLFTTLKAKKRDEISNSILYHSFYSIVRITISRIIKLLFFITEYNSIIIVYNDPVTVYNNLIMIYYYQYNSMVMSYNYTVILYNHLLLMYTDSIMNHHTTYLVILYNNLLLMY